MRQTTMRKVCFYIKRAHLNVPFYIAHRITEKVFIKDSSLVTMPLNLMNIKVLWCDELRFQLVTWGFLRVFFRS